MHGNKDRYGSSLPLALALLLATLSACSPAQTPPSPIAPTVSSVRPSPTPVTPAASAPEFACNPENDATTAGPSLTQGSVRLLGTLEHTVHVSFFTTTGRPKLDAFVCAVARLLREYQRAGAGKFAFEAIDTGTDEGWERAQTLGLKPTRLGECEDCLEGVLGLTFSYGSAKAVIPNLYPDEPYGIEFWLSNKLRELHDTEHNVRRRIGVITSKGGLLLTDTNLVPKGSGIVGPSLHGIMKQAFPFYSIEEVKLSPGVTIDEGLMGLIVTQPGDRYTQEELRAIDDFVMRGGKTLVVYASAVALDAHDVQMRARLRATGLEPLLSGYGIQLNTDAVFDFGAPLQLGPDASSSPTMLRYPGVPHLQSRVPIAGTKLDSGFGPFFKMDSLPFPFPSSLTLLAKRQPADVTLRGVASTSDQSSSETTARLNLLPSVARQPEAPLQSRTIAAVAEGRLQSAFAEKASASTNRRAPTPSRVLVVASGLFLTNPFAYAGNASASNSGDQSLRVLAQPYTKHLTSTILSFKNTLDWLTGDLDLVEASSKLIVPSE